jgi:hypothetical protein
MSVLVSSECNHRSTLDILPQLKMDLRTSLLSLHPDAENLRQKIHIGK